MANELELINTPDPNQMDVIKPKLTDNEALVVRYMEQTFWEVGSIPTNEVIEQRTGISQDRIRAMWKKDVFRNALMARGIQIDLEDAKGILTMEQLTCANLLLNLHDKRTDRQKIKAMKDAGFEISSQQYHAWMRQPAFRDYITKRAEQLFKSSNFQAYKAVTQSIEEGDLAAVKLSWEMQGIYNPKVQVDVNVGDIIVKLLEIITRNVTDPDILQVIASEVEQLGVVEVPALNAGPMPIVDSIEELDEEFNEDSSSNLKNLI